MRRKIKKFLNRNLCFLICFVFIIFFIFMANGYSILNMKLNLNMKTTILEEEPWLPKVSFVNARRIGNVFFYNIIIYNNSKFCYKDWKITMYNNDYIGFTDMLER